MTSFQFKLTPRQAQDIFSALACFLDERQLVKDTFGKHAKQLRKAARRYERQLNAQYKATGIEV